MPEGPLLEGIHRMLEAPSPKVRELGEKALAEMREADLLNGLLDPRLSLAALLHFALLSSQRGRPDWAQALSENPSFPEGGRDLLGRVLACSQEKKADGETGTRGEGGTLEETEPEPTEGEPEEEAAGDECDAAGKKLSAFQRIMKMTAGQKIKLAFRGDKEARSILIKESNREIYFSVLENPGMTEAEIEVISRNAGTNKDILRAIAKNKDWMANMAIVRALVNNPKTPVEVSNRYLTRLTDKDLDMMEKSRGLPSLLRTNAKRILAGRKQKKG